MIKEPVNVGDLLEVCMKVVANHIEELYLVQINDVAFGFYPAKEEGSPDTGRLPVAVYDVQKNKLFMLPEDDMFKVMLRYKYDMAFKAVAEALDKHEVDLVEAVAKIAWTHDPSDT